MIMTRNQHTTLATVIRVLRVLIVGESIVFLLAALTHIGLRIPLGFVVLTTNRMVAALVVGGISGIFLAASVYLILTHRPQAWLIGFLVQVFALAGVLLGIWSIAAGYGPHDPLNDGFHRVLLVVIVAGLILLLTPAAREALDYPHH